MAATMTVLGWPAAGSQSVQANKYDLTQERPALSSAVNFG